MHLDFIWEISTHGGHIGRLKVHPWNNFSIFYVFELKLCRMVELRIPKNRMLFFDFNGFWRENDVTRLTAKFKFQVMAKQINNFERV